MVEYPVSASEGSPPSVRQRAAAAICTWPPKGLLYSSCIPSQHHSGRVPNNKLRKIPAKLWRSCTEAFQVSSDCFTEEICWKV